MLTLNKLNTFYAFFVEMSKTNPVIAGVIGLYGLTVITFLFRNFPSFILGKIKRELTTTLVINSNDTIFYNFLMWISATKNHSFVRNLNLTNPNRYGYSEAIISIGYGRIYFMFEGHTFFMDRQKVETNNTSDKKEVINLTLIGRNKSIFNKLFNKIKEQDADHDKYTKVYHYKDNCWQILCKNYKRSLDTVIIEEIKKKEITNHIDNFLKDKSWHIDNGIPWRTGVLLFGPPGTGKTSLIKSLCSHYNKSIYIINLSKMTDDILNNALSDVPEGAVIALEDIDSAGIGTPRNNGTEQQNDTTDVINGTQYTLQSPSPSLSKDSSQHSLRLAVY